MLNYEAKHPIHILKPNKEWINLNYPEIENVISLENITFDSRGWMWAVASRPESKSGLFCLDTNGTLEDNKDDQHRFTKTFTNQDGTLVNHTIYSLAIDKKGVIWVGTAQGPLLFNNPANFFEKDFYCTQIKVPRDDGTNLADFLLAKWIGTESNGIYLLSEDGMKTIHHFTADNSPLLSNSITSTVIHPRTGEVFIGTSKGLVSYQSDAIEPKESFIKEDVYAYPNPVKSDYNGVITITGLVEETDVKITNVSGKLIHEDTSVGGQFTWNGRNMQGNKVPSGIYFVLASDKEGKQGIATKILIVK